MTGIFDGAEVISTYTDDQAVEDGVLVDTGALGVSYAGAPVNRLTDHLYGELRRELDALGPDGPEQKPWLAEQITGRLVGAHPSDDNTGEVGDIVVLPAGAPGQPPHSKLWLVRNEVGGWTAMYPEDY